MKGHKTITALAIALGIGILSYVYFKPPKARMEVYNRETKEFIQRKRGVDESLLNQIEDPLMKRSFTSKRNIALFEEAEYLEQNLKFKKISRGQYARSKRETELTLNTNHKILDLEPETRARYKRLTELLLKTDELYKKGRDKLEKVILVYDFLSTKFKSLKSGYTKGSATLTELLENKSKGDCNDLSPAYCAILNFYGIDSQLKYGKLKYADGEEDGHIWLRINLDGHTFDLDPVWYKGFAPLEPRL